MAFVIAEPGIGTKDTACVDACPVDCIHPKKNTTYDDARLGFDEIPQLYIGGAAEKESVVAAASIALSRGRNSNAVPSPATPSWLEPQDLC
jgi:NAD-dependent dihydropyrimidine dehydrogenase PreA subunit